MGGGLQALSGHTFTLRSPIMHLQISFLGKSQLDSRTGYRPARYRFDDSEVIETAFFGLALVRKMKPDRLLLLGTAGSMWDVLVENQIDDDRLEAERLALIDAVRENHVTDELLAPLADVIGERVGCPVELRVIPYGRDAAEQAQILDTVARVVSATKVREVMLDVTHGLRHLPMLALVAAFYLQHVARVDVADILYGALEMMTEEGAPVLSLRGLLAGMEWIEALSAYDRDGDYGVFVPLLQTAGLADAPLQHLRRAAHAERVFNHQYAAQELRNFLPHLEAGLPGMAALFAPHLKDRIAWAQQHDPHRRLAAIARERLAHGDFVHCAIAACSGFLASLAQRGERLSDYDTHIKIEEAFRQGQRGNPDLRDTYEELKRLRNALAHGTPPRNGDTRYTLADPERLQERLQLLLEELLPG
jgi:CRISPR-associated Csx2 family protein